MVDLADFIRRPEARKDALVLAFGTPLVGAAAGLAYYFLARPLRRLPGVGPYLAGVVTIGAYLGAFGVFIIVSGEDAGPGLWVSLIVCTLIFGPIHGYHFFRDPSEPPAP